MSAQPEYDFDWKLIPGKADPKFIVIDLFCGAGGTSTGYKYAKLRKKMCAIIAAAINHDEKALKSHWKNNMEVVHFNEDITKLYGEVRYGFLFQSAEFQRLIRMIEIYRAFYPNAKIILWASLECTNFSKAKGGQARNADSRTLAEHLDRYIHYLQPDYIKIENVVEFMAWGPMRIKCKKRHEFKDHNGDYSELAMIKDKKTGEWVYGWEPISKKNGQSWVKWRKGICNLGYLDKWDELNSANYGAYTSRNRLFGIFHRPELPASFPKPTHAKNPPKEKDLFSANLKKWNAVKEVLDFTDEGQSILNRLESIKDQKRAKELLKNQKDVKEVILLPADLEYKFAHHPLRYVMTHTMLPDFDSIVEQYRAHYGSVGFFYDDKLADKSLERIYSGLKKFVAGGEKEFAFMQQTYACASNNDANFSINQPARTVTTRDSTQIVQPSFLSKYNSGNPESRNTSLEEPAGTILTENTFALINPNFIAKNFSGRPDGKVTSTDDPAGALTTIPNQSLVQPKFLSKYYSGDPESKNTSVDEPAATLRTKDGQALIQPNFIVQRNSGNPEGRVVDINGPARALTSSAGNQELVSTEFLANYNGRGANVGSVDNPAGTITTKDRFIKIKTVWLDKNYNGPTNHQSVELPAGALMTKDKYSIIQPNFINRPFSSGGDHSSVEDPAGAVMPSPKMNLVQTQFIANPNYTNACSSIEEPLHTITANRKHHLLINPQFNNGGSSVEQPCFTLIAGMDKRPPYLIVTEEGEIAIEVYDSDSEITVKIKEFMAMYGISDIKMRMLKVGELLKIQGFPGNYHLEGSQADKKKFIGNSVVPHVVRCWAEQLAMELERFFPEIYLNAA